MAADQASREAVREALSQAANALLIGPLKENEVIESAPADTYLTGILWPRGARLDGIDDDAGLDAGGDAESGVDSAIPGYRAIRPCSIGITFAVKAGTTVVVTLGDTARYEPSEVLLPDQPVQNETSGDTAMLDAAGDGVDERAPSGLPGRARAGRKVWSRKPLGYSVRLEPNARSSTVKISTFLDAQGGMIVDPRVSLHVRRRAGHDQHVFTVTLINEELEAEDAGPRDARCLFQAGLVVQAWDGASGSIQPRPRPPINSSDEDALTNALLYRDIREFAVGHGIATIWQREPAESVGEVRTAWLPETHVPGTSPDGHELLVAFRREYPDALKAAFLGNESARGDVTAAMAAFADCYADWIGRTLRVRVGQFDKELRRAAETNLERCLTTVMRIRAGVDMLVRDDAAWIAFALANAAMDRQSRYRAKGEGAKPLVWRPFQLAFMLLVIPGLANPAVDDRQCMDLLWFPTGGGKTEAYLALTAFQIFHRRLVDDSRRQLGGVDVLMRYTLRLLTVQQFQRAASLISACDAMREADTVRGIPHADRCPSALPSPSRPSPDAASCPQSHRCRSAHRQRGRHRTNATRC